MKVTKLVFLIALSFILTACYPTGEITGNIEIEYGGDINVSSRENLQLKILIPENYQKTFNVSMAQPRKFDPSLAEELFPDSTKNLTEKIENPDEHYFLYRNEDSVVSFHEEGSMYYMTTKSYMEEYRFTVFKKIVCAPMPVETFRMIFPKTELSEFSSEMALQEMKRITDKLDIDVGEPEVYALENEEEKKIADWCKRDYKLKTDGYYIHYPVYLGGLQIVDAFENNISSNENWIVPFSFVSCDYTKSGIQDVSVEGIFETSETCEDIEICSPEFAAAQIKNMFENTIESGTLYGCELKALVYWDKSNSAKEYKVRPVWEFGWEYGDDILGKMFQPYYVDAETGMIY